MNTRDKSFRLDQQTLSFRASDFTRRDLPLLVLAFGLLTLFSLVFGWLPAKLLSEKWLGVFCGFILGFSCGILVCSWLWRRAAGINCDLSPEVQVLAREPSQLVAAIDLFRKEHSGICHAAAKERIETFCKTGQ